MTVTYARGYPQTIEIPGGGGQGTGAREILDLVHHPDWFERNGWQRHWRDWNPDDSDVHAS